MLVGPILDRDEYVERYHKFLDEGVPLGSAGELIAQTLRAWAVSFGFDENGCEVAASATENQTAALSRRKSQTNQRVRIILRAVDVNAIPRTISWDGVRVLLLLLPLTQDVMPEHDRSVNVHLTHDQAQRADGTMICSNCIVRPWHRSKHCQDHLSGHLPHHSTRSTKYSKRESFGMPI